MAQRLPAHTLPGDLRSRRVRPLTRVEWRRRLHLLPAARLRSAWRKQPA